jgi:hypothetical protein
MQGKLVPLWSVALWLAYYNASADAEITPPPYTLPDATFDGSTYATGTDPVNFANESVAASLSAPGSVTSETPDDAETATVTIKGTPAPDLDVSTLIYANSMSRSATAAGTGSYFLEIFDSTGAVDPVSVAVNSEINFVFNPVLLSADNGGGFTQGASATLYIGPPTLIGPATIDLTTTGTIVGERKTIQNSSDSTTESAGYTNVINGDFTFETNTLYEVGMYVQANVAGTCVIVLGCEAPFPGALVNPVESNVIIDPTFQLVSPDPDLTLAFSPGIGDTPASSIPEPPTWVMMALGFIGLAGARRFSSRLAGL